MRSSFILGIIVISASLLAACGHKGPLMLPDAGIQTSPPPESIAPVSGVPATQSGQQP